MAGPASNEPPINLISPTITADGGSVGSTLTDQETDTWEPAPDSRSLQWFLDDAPIVGATAGNYVTGAPGSYKLQVIAVAGLASSDPAFSNTIEISEA